MEYAKLFRKTYASSNDINKLCPLPETENEVLTFNKALSSKENKIFLGKDLTESNYKKLNNISSEIILFATHGITSGEMNELDQSGLVFTPPLKSSLFDDGLLTADEISKINIESNLVILSACNTAIEKGNAPINSLSSAFFFAGARSVLASHRPVESISSMYFTKKRSL